MRIKRVDDQVKQLLHLGFELERFGLRGLLFRHSRALWWNGVSGVCFCLKRCFCSVNNPLTLAKKKMGGSNTRATLLPIQDVQYVYTARRALRADGTAVRSSLRIPGLEAFI